ncbi:alpha/beta-hydrolase [Viridothelium virens]|uniref:Carboxylic ester hydrolase n=1 Tax=Viridothelium virens TaxID=1048519 RepID=A0A6A6GY02_VIRVR|nr:alpha/beta-hydrolase [Viridothelium virens]
MTISRYRRLQALIGIHSFWLLCSLCLLARLCIAAEPTVYNDQTKITYQGKLKDSVEHFQNIKFAQDTSGSRRFAAPEPFLPPANTVVDATNPGPACPQLTSALPPFFSEVDRISEDCLNLYIARPAGLDITLKNDLPVVVWIHGGGVVKGSAYDGHTVPEKMLGLAQTDGKSVIYVAINYRLTIFGFPRSKTLKDNKSLNLGMRDQRMGLQWVKDNIRAFGGDPERITVYGLSAGGTFTSLQQMAFGGKEGAPFQQAWMMSGPPGTAINTTSDATEIHTRAVAELVGCQTDSDAEMVACLREVPMQKLLDSTMQYSATVHPPTGLFTFIPSIDDDFLPDQPSKLFRNGRFVKGINSVFGWTQDDGALNAGPGHSIRSEEDMMTPIKNFAHALTPEHYARLFSLYPAADFEEDVRNYEARKGQDDPDISVHFFRVSRILRDLLFTCSSIDFGHHIIKYSPPDFDGVRLYDLNQSVLGPLWKGAGMPYIGVSHGSDTNYIFNGVFPEGEMTQEDTRLSQEFTRNFINFAHTGNPTPEETSIEWPPAYKFVNIDRDTGSEPSGFNLLIVGGPLGTQSVSVPSSLDSTQQESLDRDDDESGYVGKIQEVLADFVGYGKMDPAATSSLQRNIEDQKLLQRCTFINSLSKVLGN